ncbi:hypothetical protein [Halioxenophilus aromaticivorans]|uniref:Uncharacterized protein n=1 Tax=Halioxenophilus aromaticivorans TaxID=1306992 RepID=A0AAV3U321_9ALTE
MNSRTTLCLRHRRALEMDPERATQCWHQAIHCARYEVNAKQWERAKNRYFHAIEVAEILLFTDNNPNRSEARMLQTCTEYAYLLHSMTLPTCGLAKYARACFSNSDKPDSIKKLTNALQDIALSSPNQCEHWLTGIAQSHFLPISNQLH